MNGLGLMRSGATQQEVHMLLFSCSVVSDSATPRCAAHQASLSFTISQSLLKLMSIESVMSSNHLVLCCPLLLLPSIFPSIRVFSNESALHIRWLKYWSFSISPCSEYSELISFRIEWFVLHAVQGTLKSLLKYRGLKVSNLWCSAFSYGPALTSVHDYMEDYSFVYMNLYQQSAVSAF